MNDFLEVNSLSELERNYGLNPNAIYDVTSAFKMVMKYERVF